ncbi:MAG: FISUMP domain-containing protein [Bacteroidota bacterium]
MEKSLSKFLLYSLWLNCLIGTWSCEKPTTMGSNVTYIVIVDEDLPPVINSEVNYIEIQSSVESISSSSATVKSLVTNINLNGNVSVIKHGHIWSTSPIPEIGDPGSDFSNFGALTNNEYISNIINLESNTTYFFRSWFELGNGTRHYQETNLFFETNNAISFFIDERDGLEYQAVELWGQIWMAENLKYEIPSNFFQICPSNNPTYCEDYGRLYSWEAIMNGQAQGTPHIRGICPVGWHIPSVSEWESLLIHFPNAEIAYDQLTPAGTTGFNAQLGGTYNSSIDFFFDRTRNGYFWTSQQETYFDFWKTIGEVQGPRTNSALNRNFNSCRCIKD